MIEIIIALVLLVIAIVPMINQTTYSHRIVVSANRMYQVTSFSQHILDAICELAPGEFPSAIRNAGAGTKVTLLQSGEAPSTAAPDSRWGSITQYWGDKQPEDAVGSVTARKLTNGSISVRVEFVFQRLKHDARTAGQGVYLTGLVSPRAWQI